MGNNINHIQPINFIKLFRTPRDQGNYKNKAESGNLGLRFFPINFDGCISFKLSEYTYQALILDHL